MRPLIPLTGAPQALPNFLPKAHLLTPSHWDLGFARMSFGGTQTFNPFHTSASFSLFLLSLNWHRDLFFFSLSFSFFFGFLLSQISAFVTRAALSILPASLNHMHSGALFPGVRAVFRPTCFVIVVVVVAVHRW